MPNTTTFRPSEIGRKASFVSWSNAALAGVAGCLLLTATDAAAVWQDRLELFASESITNDDNVFRISKDRNAQSYLGSSDIGDTYRNTAVGFNLDYPVSLQRFQVNVTWNNIHYDRFTELDFNGRTSRAVWMWQAGSKLSGQVGFTDSLALASFNDIQARVRDPLKTQQPFFNATWQIAPRWRLDAGASDMKQRNDVVVLQENDVDVQDTNLTFSYISRRENQIGITVGEEEGRYPHRQFIAGTGFDNAYTQHSAGLVTTWTDGGASRIDANISRVHREFRQLSQRNFDGTTYRVAYDWKPREKFSLAVVLHRDISATEDIHTSFILEKGFSLQPSLDLTDKLNLSGSIDYSIRDYLGNPDLALGIVPARSDRLRLMTATLSYRVARALTLLFTLRREENSSNIQFGDYTANVATLTARISF